MPKVCQSYSAAGKRIYRMKSIFLKIPQKIIKAFALLENKVVNLPKKKTWKHTFVKFL